MTDERALGTVYAGGRSAPTVWQARAQSTNGRIFIAALTVGSLTLGVKIAGMLKEMAIASIFGTSDAMDAFLMAFLLPSYVINVVSGSFSAAMIPTHVETLERDGPRAAQRLFSGTVAFSTAVLGSATLVLAVAGPAILAPLCSGFRAETVLLTTKLFYLLLPTIVVSGFIANWAALLNAGERFGLAAFSPVTVPLATVAAVIVGWRSWGIYSVALGTVVGYGCQLVVLGWSLKRRRVPLLPRWHGLDGPLRQVISQYLPMIAGSVLFCSSMLVDQAMAGMLAPGSVAALNYGNKLVALATGIGTMALGTAVLPHFSKMSAAADWSGVRHTLRIYIRLILLVTVPVTAAAMVFSTPIVALLFQRGQFTAADTVLVSRIQQMLLLQVPFFSVSIVCVRMMSSLKLNHLIMWGTVLGFTLNVSLNYILMKSMGAAGIALSTSLVYVATCAFSATILYRKLREPVPASQ